MKYLELSEENTREESRKLAQKIKKDFIPEIVIFVAIQTVSRSSAG